MQKAIRQSRRDRTFFAVVGVIMVLLLIVAGYPLLYILANSLSDRMQVLSGRVFIIPRDFSLEGYQKVFEYNGVLASYANTLFYTVAGTFMNICVTMVAAYAFSRQGWPLKKFMTLLFTFTMFFNGGMIPNYILMSRLELLDTRWAILLPGLLSIYNMIIARTFIQNTIPSELYEASALDGCDEIRYFLRIVLPLSKAIIAVLTLYYAVGHWNAYFNAMIYLSKRELYPLQLILREILIINKVDAATTTDELLLVQKQGVADVLRYSLIVVSTAPIMCLYPFVQKYFMKGVMIGSVKG